MSSQEPPSGGIFDSLRKLGDTGLALLQNRLELFGVEVEEQKTRLVRLLLLAGATIFLTNTAVLVVTATVVLLAGEKARVPVLIGVCCLYVAAAAASFLFLRKEINSAPRPFDGTLSELEKDRDRIHPQNPDA